MRYTFTLLLTLLIFLSQKIDAQKVWSLQDCIDYANSHNLQIKLQMLDVQLKEDQLLQNKATLLPDLNAIGTHSYNYGKTVDRFTNQFANERIQSNNFYVSSRVTLFSGFQLLNSVKKSQLELMASKYDVDKMRNDISLTIATAYLQVLYNIEFLTISESQLKTTQLQAERTKKMVEAGVLSPANQFNIEAQQAQEELQLVNAQNQLQLAYLTLAQLLDLPLEGFEIARPEIKISDESVLTLRPDQIYEFAISNQPEIKSAEFRLQSAEKGLDIARGSRSPSLSLSGSYGTGYSGASKELSGNPVLNGYYISGFTSGGDTVYTPTFKYNYQTKPWGNQIDDNSNYTLGFQLNVPIFNGFQTRTAISRSKLAIENAEINIQLAKNNLLKTIQQAHADALAALNKYKAAQKSVTSLEESFRYMQQKFDVGMLNSVEYNDAKNRLISAQSQLLQAKYEYIFRIKVLDFYMGKPLILY